MSWIFNILSALPRLQKIFEIFFGNKASRDATAAANEHSEQIAVHQEQADGFSYKAVSRNWFDSLIDGINRLPRPLMTLGICYLVYWAGANPTHFSVAMEALGKVPTWMASVIAIIVTFWFGGRTLGNDIPRLLGKAQLAQPTQRVAQASNQPTPNPSIEAWRKSQAETSS